MRFLPSSFFTQLLFEHLVLGAKVLDHFLLLPVDPPSKDKGVELPGLQDEVNRQPVG